jgi:hypothetical protein
MENQLFLQEEALITRAWEDTAFREALIEDPREVMTELGVNLPSNLKVKVLEETADTVFFVLPKKPEYGIAFENREALEKLEMTSGTYNDCDSWGCGTGGVDC